MGQKLGIYYEPTLLSLAQEVTNRLEYDFPNVHAVLHKSLEVPDSAWDTFRGQYDIQYLLNYLECPQNADFILWLIQGDIGDYWHAYLYGAAVSRKAIVSTARLGTLDMVLKEACHEIGHLFGLGHCNGDCVMHTSRNESQVAAKSSSFCKACSSYLEVANASTNNK